MEPPAPPFSSADGLFVEELTPSPEAPVSSSAPPASSDNHQIPLVLPAVFEVKQRHLRRGNSVANSREQFYKQELDVSRLNAIHKHLWLAGLPQHPRPLHNQIEIGRTIRITEKADMHMLWIGSTIFLKPLPDFLLCHKIWQNQLCKDIGPYTSALGFLQSYVWLIAYPSDHKIALDHGLLHPAITWAKWSTFVSVLISNGIIEAYMNPRYRFGELRLPRIHWISGIYPRPSLRSITRGYSSSCHTYSSFLERNLSWLLTVFLYIAVVLTAMQVGLSTSHLKDSVPFQKVSWIFTVLSIAAPLLIICMVVLYTLILVSINLIFTWKRKGRKSPTASLGDEVALANYDP